MDSKGITASLQQISENLDFINAVSFEIYNLGPNGTLVFNDGLTSVTSQLQEMEVETYAMVSSYPYPPEFLDYMRYLFYNDSAGFIQQTIDQAQALQLTGYNADFEPIGNVTYEDAEQYALFLDKWAGALHEAGFKLTVDTATWSILWNYTYLAETELETIISMSTYTDNDASFTRQLDNIAAYVAPEQLGIGLETDLRNYTSSELAGRLKQVSAYNITQVDVWLMPLPDSWIAPLRAWANTA
jgi:hypothetical protein